MSVATRRFSLSTRGHTQILNITEKVALAIEESGLKRGIFNISVPGSTAGITTIEYESGLAKDLTELLDRLVPTDRSYHHDEHWHDYNGYAHIRSALIGTSFSGPFEDGRPILGTWQQIVFLDFDNRPRQREVVVQLVGE
jgi:secondary thiamine-phosphate synthase enzyme